MKIVVNDTNIFIDLYSIGMLEQFFELPISVHTVDFIISELKDKAQFAAINKYMNNRKLYVYSFTSAEVMDIYDMQSKAGGNVSSADCAVWYYAKKNSYTLLTGDGQLRKKAIESEVTVMGIISVFDMLIEYNIISPQFAITKMGELMKLNARLPKKIIEDRIEEWDNM